eukprot:jgi/Psemu1/290490/fgenesh1_pg.506_\
MTMKKRSVFLNFFLLLFCACCCDPIVADRSLRRTSDSDVPNPFNSNAIFSSLISREGPKSSGLRKNENIMATPEPPPQEVETTGTTNDNTSNNKQNLKYSPARPSRGPIDPTNPLEVDPVSTNPSSPANLTSVASEIKRSPTIISPVGIANRPTPAPLIGGDVPRQPTRRPTLAPLIDDIPGQPTRRPTTTLAPLTDDVPGQPTRRPTLVPLTDDIPGQPTRRPTLAPLIDSDVPGQPTKRPTLAPLIDGDDPVQPMSDVPVQPSKPPTTNSKGSVKNNVFLRPNRNSVFFGGDRVSPPGGT